MKTSVSLVAMLAIAACSAAPAPDEITTSNALAAVAVDEGDYVLQSTLAGKCLDVFANSASDDAQIQEYDCNGTTAQLFRLSKTDSGYYRIVNATTSKSLGGSSMGQSLRQSDWTGSPAQQWAFVADGNGAYVITHRATGDVVDVRSANTANETPVQTWPANGTAAQAWKLVLVKKAAAGAPSVPTPAPAPVPPAATNPSGIIPPATWQEHWFEHNQLLQLVGYNDDVALYFDADVDRTKTTWMLPYVTRVWQYTKRTYGNFGPENRLYAVFHTGKYAGGHPASYFDASHDFRNTVDLGGGDWATPTGWNVSATIHEVGHIVEAGGQYGRRGSPAFPLWRDSKWAEIFVADAMRGIGDTTEATRWHNAMVDPNHVDSFPVANSHWYRDWYDPIVRTYGGAKPLAAFFGLLAKYFPADASGSYTRNLNWGEYVHFLSAAAGADLRPLATQAFGWPAEWESQYEAARTEFPGVTY